MSPNLSRICTFLDSQAFHAFVASLMFATVAAWSCNDAGATETLTRMPLGSVDSLAVCNDGSEASYYFKNNENPKLWLVYLAGGGWCFDEASCQSRFDGSGYPHHDCSNSSASAPCFMSSRDYTESCGKTGVFDALTMDGEQSAVATANKIYVPYCSSDAHMGDGEFNGWQFRGARIVRAVVGDLLAKQGLGHEPATLLFGGGSAGGRGAMTLLDEMSHTLQGRDVRVLGFLDSPYYIDIASFNMGFAGMQPQHSAVLANFNAKSVVPWRCAEKHREEEWKCLFGVYRMPLVETPYLLLVQEYDSWQLSHLVHDFDGIETSAKFTAEELSYVDQFGAQTLEDLKNLRPPSGSMLHATACFNHHITEKTAFYNVKTTDGISQNTALSRFLVGSASRKNAIDECAGFECGGGCSMEFSTLV